MHVRRSSGGTLSGFTPNRIMLGREVRLLFDIVFGSSPTVAGVTYGEYVDDLVKQMITIHALVHHHSKQATESQKDDYHAH